MALLLAMYQKLRLIREKNQLTLDLTKYTSKVDRIQKNIERTQKRYTSLFAQLESQAKMMQSQATVQFQKMTGLGVNSVNPYSYTGLNQFIYQFMGNALKGDGGYITVNAGKENETQVEMDPEIFKKMWAEYTGNNGRFIPQIDEKTNQQLYADDNTTPLYKNFTYDQIQLFTQALQGGQMAQQQAQMWTQQATQQYGNNISIWLDAQKAQLEAQQDAALEPLNYEETMMELEKEQTQMKLERINAQIDSYSQLVSQEAKNSAPTFGLG